MKGRRSSGGKENRLHPSLTHDSYLVLTCRRELLEAEVNRLRLAGGPPGVLLDVGGHEKPYEPLFRSIVSRYVAVDLPGSHADVIGVGEALPFRSDRVDIVLCTQVLEHVRWPQDVVDEIHRVLKPGGKAFISVPHMYPLHGSPHDNWRFMSGGLRVMLERFSDVRVMAEGGTVASLFRTVGLYLLVFTGRRWGRPFAPIVRYVVLPISNLVGSVLDKVAHSGDQFAANWLAVATK